LMLPSREGEGSLPMRSEASSISRTGRFKFKLESDISATYVPQPRTH
jgi:hypothetical protein